jgi:CHASE3 domain sensor protein
VKRGLTFRSAVASALLLAVVVAGFVVMAAAVVRLQDADESESHSVEAQSTANALLKSTLDLETGVRGFVVSGKERLLESF